MTALVREALSKWATMSDAEKLAVVQGRGR